jgi:uncharacterized protein
LVFNIRQLGLFRKPGTWHKVDLTVKAPEDLKIEVIGIPEGSDIRLDVQLESVVEGIYVSGSIFGTAVGIDVRTLEPLSLDIEADIQEHVVYADAEVSEDEDLYVLDGERLDFEPVLRNAMVMALPFSPVHDDGDTDFRYQVGDDLEIEEEDDSADPRWAALQGLLDEKKES